MLSGVTSLQESYTNECDDLFGGDGTIDGNHYVESVIESTETIPVMFQVPSGQTWS